MTAVKEKQRADVERYRRNWQNEVDSAAQYHAMADAEEQTTVAEVYRKLAVAEEKHATFWEERLHKVGKPPGERVPSWRARVLVWVARRMGPQMILPTIASKESDDRDVYTTQPETQGTRMTEEEHMHARVLEGLLAKRKGVSGPLLARVEARHRSASGNALRAAVLGANDGLCSNLALVMGVAGADVGHRTVVLTGIAGLLAGACSMALGEWVSVTSARELAEREIQLEKDELEEAPEEEREELQLIYQGKGLSAHEAKELSKKMMQNPKMALDALTREELGIDPAELGGSPNVAALTSLLLFSLGAIVPLFPWFFLEGGRATIASVACGGVALFAVGAAITLFTGKSVWFSGGRQLLLGFAAAAITFGVGRAIGVAVQ